MCMAGGEEDVPRERMRRGGPLVVSLRARPLESMGAEQICVVEEHGSLFTAAGLEIGGYGRLR